MLDKTVTCLDFDAVARLAELGVAGEVLREAVEAGVQHASDCTAHDPPSLAGIIAWGKATRHLRDRLVPLGWTRDNARNYATVLSPDGAVAIAVAAANSATGQAEATPSNRSTKGPATRDAIDWNQTSFADVSESFRVCRATSRPQTWLLLYFVDEDNDEVRLELSLPAYIDDDGYVTAWRERVLLLPLSLDSRAPPIRDETEQIDIKIERRASGS